MSKHVSITKELSLLDIRNSLYLILCHSLRSWRYCRRARKKVLAAEPLKAARNISKCPSPFSSRLLTAPPPKLFNSRAPTIPPATQATSVSFTPKLILVLCLDNTSYYNSRNKTTGSIWCRQFLPERAFQLFSLGCLLSVVKPHPELIPRSISRRTSDKKHFLFFLYFLMTN